MRLICRSLFCGLSWIRSGDLGMACPLADVDGRDAVTGSGLVRPRRSVAALALAQARLASDPAVRSRLRAMAAQASQAAFARNDPMAGGPGARRLGRRIPAQPGRGRGGAARPGHPLRQGHYRDQPRQRHEIRVIKRRMNLRRLV